jgi:3-hydroxyisobutyrate dehydrogenase
LTDQVTAVEGRGAKWADEPAEVVRGADVVITMLPTAPIVLDLVESLLEDWPEETIWLQMSSVGASEADQLVEVARAHDVTLVDAPVSGSTHPAEEGELTILASGPDSARMGSRLKMAANHWMIAMTAALAESMHLCEAMGLDQRQFVELLDGGPLGSAYGLLKLDEMRTRDYPVGFPVRLALKDLELVREVEQSSKAPMPLLDASYERFLAADEDHADEDLAAVYEVGRSG